MEDQEEKRRTCKRVTACSFKSKVPISSLDNSPSREVRPSRIIQIKHCVKCSVKEENSPFNNLHAMSLLASHLLYSLVLTLFLSTLPCFMTSILPLPTRSPILLYSFVSSSLPLLVPHLLCTLHHVMVTQPSLAPAPPYLLS